jgi:hypothetical protein
MTLVELYLHSPIYFHHVVLKAVQVFRNNLTLDLDPVQKANKYSTWSYTSAPLHTT